MRADTLFVPCLTSKNTRLKNPNNSCRRRCCCFCCCFSFVLSHTCSFGSIIITQKAISTSNKAIIIVISTLFLLQYYHDHPRFISNYQIPSNDVIMMRPTITSVFVLVFVALLSSSSETVVQAKRFRGSETLQALSLAEEARGLDGASSSSAAALSPPPAERRPRR